MISFKYDGEAEGFIACGLRFQGDIYNSYAYTNRN